MQILRGIVFIRVLSKPQDKQGKSDAEKCLWDTVSNITRFLNNLVPRVFPLGEGSDLVT